MRGRDAQLNAQRRQAILEAAGNCFVRHGFHATGMKDVCREAGMSPGTLYHYVRSKADIIAGIIQREGQLSAQLLEPLGDAPDFIAALFDALDRVGELTTERDLVLYAEITAEVLRQPELRQDAERADLRSRTMLGAAIARGQSNGQIDATLDPARAATTILSVLDGLLWQASLHGLPHFRSQLPALKQSIARMLIDPDQAV